MPVESAAAGQGGGELAVQPRRGVQVDFAAD